MKQPLPPKRIISWLIVVAGTIALIWMAVNRLQQEEGEIFPSRVVNIICPYAAGGGTDLFARSLARAAEPILNQTVMVQNITGGGGAVGFAAGLIAPPTGYTVTAVTFELVSLPLQGMVPFTPDDFDLLLRINMDPGALAVNKNTPVDSVQSFIEWAREKGGVSIGNSGPGSVWHLAAALMADQLDIPVTFIPFSGAAPAVTALVGGHIDAVVVGPGEMQTQVEAGLIRLLAVMSDERLDFIPDIPTFMEEGHDVVFGTWRGLAVPQGVPELTRERLSTAFKEAMESPGFIEMAQRGALNLSFADGEQFRREVNQQTQDVGRLMERLGLK